jgi:hypothetical protein
MQATARMLATERGVKEGTPATARLRQHQSRQQQQLHKHLQLQEQGSKSLFLFKGRMCWILKYFIQYCFVCRHLDSTVSDDAGIEARTVATNTLAI